MRWSTRRAWRGCWMSGNRNSGKGGVAAGGVLAVILAAVAFIAPWEGMEQVPYRDLVGKLTWCYGETRGVPKESYTEAECAAMLATGVGQFYDGVMRCINRPVTQGQAVAIVSLAYNAGLSAICNSTMIKMINRGESPEVWC